MPQPLLALCRAGIAPGAAGDRSLGFALDRRATDGTQARQHDFARLRWPPFQQHTGDLRYDIAGASHHDRIADAHPFAFHFVHVVQRRIADGHAAHEHRRKPRDRGNRPGAAHLELDVAQCRQGFVSRKFVGDGPAGRARHEAQAPLVLQSLDFVDHTVDLVGQR